jgi:hypothetical protein
VYVSLVTFTQAIYYFIKVLRLPFSSPAQPQNEFNFREMSFLRDSISFRTYLMKIALFLLSAKLPRRVLTLSSLNQFALLIFLTLRSEKGKKCQRAKEKAIHKPAFF